MSVRAASILLVPLLAGLVSPAAGASGSGVTTEVSGVRVASAPSGTKTMLTYDVAHEFGETVAPGTSLPGARVPRTAAFDGLWGDSGHMAAWLAPTGSFQFQFEPESSLIENAYYSNRLLGSQRAVPLNAGDRFDVGAGNIAWNAPLPSERDRGPATGRLGWDVTTESRRMTARFGGDEAEMEAIFLRADIVARGGDVDARGGVERVPPVVIDLPTTYPLQPIGGHLLTMTFPYTHYVASMDMRVLPSVGKAVLTANVRGYIPEAKEYELPGGADIAEWHIPINGVIMLSSIDDPAFQPTATVGLPEGGVAAGARLGGETHRVEVGPDGAVTLGASGIPAVTGEPQAEGAAPAGAGPTIEELRAAQQVNHALREPADLVQGNAQYELTVDPHFRGQGVLALTGVTRGRTGTRFADATSLTHVIIDGEPMKLSSSRLIDLRVFPQYRYVTVGHTGGGGGAGPLSKTRTLWGAAHQPGLVIDAVYDLGDERYAFLQMEGGPYRPFDPSFRTDLEVISMKMEAAQVRPVFHVELPAGEVAYNGEVASTEFSAPLDAPDAPGSLRVGRRFFRGAMERSGRVTVLRAPAPITAAPQADPGRSLEGSPVALVYEGTPEYPSGSHRTAVHRLDLIDDYPSPASSPKPIGTACGTPQAVDQETADALPQLDIVEGWLDADDANLYATIRLREPPATPPGGGTYRYSFHWRYAHGGWFARANLSSDGTWTFDHGGFNGGSFFKTSDVTGEVSGSLVRIAVPRTLHELADGALFRDTGAHAWMEAPPLGLRAMDSAPQGADPTYGTGGDYRVNDC